VDGLTDLFRQFSDALEIAPIEVTLAVFVVILFLILFIISFMGYFRTVLNIAYFAYPNARVRAIGNPCINRMYIYEISEAKTVYEVLERIRGIGYKIDLGDSERLENVERMMDAMYVRECSKLEETAPEGIKPFFRAYLMLLEAEHLKSAIRYKIAGLPAEEIEENLVPIGVLTPTMIQKIADANDVEEVILLMQNTPYGHTLTEALQDYTRERTPLSFELSIERLVFETLHASILHLDTTMVPPVKEFVDLYSDITNINMMLRAKRDGLESGVIQKYLLPAGRDLPVSKLKQISEVRDIREVLAALEDTRYKPAIDRALPAYEESRSIRPFETSFEQVLLDRVIDIGVIHQHAAGPLIKFLVARHYEIRNLRAVLWGIHEGVPAERIKKLMICEGVVT